MGLRDWNVIDMLAKAIASAKNNPHWDEQVAFSQGVKTNIEGAGYVIVPRVPTKKMLSAAAGTPFADQIWQAMIDAALEEK